MNATDEPTGADTRTSARAADSTDRGSVLLLVLAMVVIGALIVIPVMTYGVSVLKANTVLSTKTQRFEAVKAGMRTALHDPLELYRQCDEEVTPKAVSSIEVSGVQIDTSCQLVGFANTVIGDHLRYGLVATEVGQSIPAALKGKKYASTAAPADWVGLATTSFQDPGNTDAWDKIWLPDLPTHARTIRTRVEGHDMPSGFGGCKVFFPGKYVDDVVLDGKTFFTSGIYYFEGEVRVLGGADVVVGDGRTQGCATSQEAVFFADPPLPAGQPHNITGFGATWLFGGEGRLVVSNANNQPLRLDFNRRYVDDPNTDPSLFVSIASVNGDLDGLGNFVDYLEPGFVQVPRSDVMIDKDTVELATLHEMTPSVLTDVARVPAAPTVNPPVAYRVAGSDLMAAGNNGAAYVTWQPLTAAQSGGVLVDRYEVFVRGEATPRCTVVPNQQQSLAASDPIRQRLAGADQLECLVTGLSGPVTAATTHTIDVVAVNAVGASAPGTVTVAVRNGASGTPAVHSALNPPGVPTTTRYNGAVRVQWTAPTTAAPSTPIVRYTVTGRDQAATGKLADRTCTTTTRWATSCIVTGLSSSRTWAFTVTATNLAGMTSAASGVSANVTPNSGTAPSPDTLNPAFTTPTPLAPLVGVFTAPIVELDLASTSQTRVRIPGYIAVPQGTIDIDNPNGHQVQVIGGLLSARMTVVDGRSTSAACTAPPSPGTPGVNCIDLGFESESVQKRLRIVSTTADGRETSVAIVQVNENGAYAVNSWEVQ
jgi:hypothetical protein